jgi:predicted nucleic acid-binding protein
VSGPNSFLPDSDCLIAVLSASHPFHEEARSEVRRRLAADEQLMLASDTIIQAYSVLTRLPRPMRVSPRNAWALIQGFRGPAPVLRLSAERVDSALSRAIVAGIAGGAIHDYLIAAAAAHAGVATLLTFNVREYGRFDYPLSVVRPALGA